MQHACHRHNHPQEYFFALLCCGGNGHGAHYYQCTVGGRSDHHLRQTRHQRVCIRRLTRSDLVPRYRFVGFTTHPKSLSGRRHLMSAPLPWWQVVIDSIHNRPISPRSISGGGSGPLASSETERTQPRFQADARRMHHTSFSTGMGPVRVQYQPADADAAAVQRLTAPRGALSVARDRLSGVRPAKARGPASPRPTAHGTIRPAASAVPPPTPPAPPPRECSDDGIVVIHPHRGRNH